MGIEGRHGGGCRASLDGALNGVEAAGDIIEMGAGMGAGDGFLHAATQFRDLVFDLFQRIGAIGDRRDEAANFIGLGQDLPQRAGFDAKVAHGLELGAEIGQAAFDVLDRGARRDFRERAAYLRGQLFHGPRDAVASAFRWLHLDLAADVAHRTFNGADLVARHEGVEATREILDLAPQCFELPRRRVALNRRCRSCVSIDAVAPGRGGRRHKAGVEITLAVRDLRHGLADGRQ